MSNLHEMKENYEIRMGLCPYTIRAINKSKLPKKVILFGSNRNYLKPNYGQDPEVELEVIVGNSENDYGQLLMQFLRDPKEIDLIRFQTMNFDNFDINPKSLVFKQTDANGSECYHTCWFKSIKENKDNRNGLQRGIVDVKFPLLNAEGLQLLSGLIINAQTQIEFELEPDSWMTVHVFAKDSVIEP